MVSKYWLMYRNENGVSYWSPINWNLKNVTTLGIVILNGPCKGMYLHNIHYPKVVLHSPSKAKTYAVWVGKDMCIKKQYFDRRGILIPFNYNVYIQKIQMEHEQFKIEQTSDGWDVVFKGGSSLVRRPIKN